MMENLVSLDFSLEQFGIWANQKSPTTMGSELLQDS